MFSSSPSLVVYRNPNSSLPFPPRLRTTVKTEITGYVGSANTSGHDFVILNSCYLPFNGSGWMNPNETLNTIRPTGVDALLNVNVYQRYRVTAAVIVLNFLPLTESDVITAVITPATTVSTYPITYQQGSTQPWSVRQLFSSSRPNGPGGGLKLRITTAEIIGVPAAALVFDPTGVTTGLYNGPPGTPLYFVINWATVDTAGLIDNLPYTVQLIQEVELWTTSTGSYPQA